MKYIMSLLFAFALVLSATPAKANNSEEVIIGVMGGVIGGLVIGGAIDKHHHHRHHRREKYIQQCQTRWFEYYDEYRDVWVRTPKRECWYERVR